MVDVGGGKPDDPVTPQNPPAIWLPAWRVNGQRRIEVWPLAPPQSRQNLYNCQPAHGRQPKTNDDRM
jgi:hypothetical protein